MTNVEKIWHILEIIEDANGLAPKGKLAQYDARKIDPVVARDDHEQIFEKLEKDEQAIEIATRPDYITENHYRWKTTPKYRGVFEKYKKLNQERAEMETDKNDRQSSLLNWQQIRTLLDSRFQDIETKSKSNWDFFLYLADYVKFVDSTPEMKTIVRSIQEQREEDFKNLRTLEAKLQKEVEEAHDKLVTIVQDKDIPTEIVKKSLKEYKDYKGGRILSSQPLAESLFDCVVEGLRALYYKGHKSEIEDFIEEEKSSTPPDIRQFIFAPTLRPYHEEKQEIETRKKTSIWFAWNELALAYLSVFNAKKTSEELREEGRKWEEFNFIGLVGEMREIMLRKDFAQRQPVQFVRADYEQYVSRVHRFLVEQLVGHETNLDNEEPAPKIYPSLQQTKLGGLQKIKCILDFVQAKREISPETQKGFYIRLRDFLEAGRGIVKNEDEVESILKKVTKESGSISVISDYATDDIDSWRIYIITIKNLKFFEQYHQRIIEELDALENRSSITKEQTDPNGVTPQDVRPMTTLDSSFVESEKRKALSITTSSDLLLILEKWQKINAILGEIYKQMPPLSETTKIPIKVDLFSYPKSYVEDVLQFLMAQKVFSYLDYERDSGVISTKYLRQYLEGQNILILNREAFENYKISVSNLCAFIEKDWKHRFSETPSLQKSVLQILRKPAESVKQEPTKALEQPIFSYNPETGDGVNGGEPTKRLTDGTPERLVFDEAYKNRGHKVSRSKVIELLGLDSAEGTSTVEPTELLSALGDSTKHRKNSKEVQITNKINSAVKEARKKLRINKKEFVNNRGNITLTL